MDRIWCTIATEGWTIRSCARNDFSALAAQTFQRSPECVRPSSSRIKLAWTASKTPRTMADYILSEMIKRGAQSWTSPDPALRCGSQRYRGASQNADLEKLCGKKEDSHTRSSAAQDSPVEPYYLLRRDVDHFLAAFDEHRKA